MREWGEFFVDKQEKKQLRRIEDEFGMTPDESQIFRDYLHECKEQGERGTKNLKGDFTDDELRERAGECLGRDSE